VARTQATNVLRALVMTAPPELRQRLADLTTTALIDNTACLGRAAGQQHSDAEKVLPAPLAEQPLVASEERLR